MKKQLLALFMAVLSLSAISQVITNGNFESWITGTYDYPNLFINNSNGQSFFKYNTPFNVVKTTDSYHGALAVQLTTYAGPDTSFGYMVNGNPSGNNPCTWTGGVAYNQIPTGMRGYYKSNTMPGDSGGVLVKFSSNTFGCLGVYMYKFGGVHNSYTPFSFTFSPALIMAPDSMIFAAVSSDVFSNVFIPGSMLQLDSISFIGAAQPAGFDGDFENWQSVTLNKPANWYQGFGPSGIPAVFQTTDVYAGAYAAEMQTYLGDWCDMNGNNCHQVARGGSISNGYSINNCFGPNCQHGGTATANQTDTLCFYYKYVPSGLDTGWVNMNFKNAGNNFMNYGGNIPPAATYQYMEIGYNTMGSLDTVIISFSSSLMNDTSLSFIGSNLKVDEVHFKSQATGIKTVDAADGLKVFPNPSGDGNFVISSIQPFDLVRVYNAYGQEVKANITKTMGGTAQVHINDPGAYFIKVNSRGKISTQKIIVGSDK
ncbi:MAG: T9SS type A sorting domain-containing protein [Bacteroidia bacterium]